MRTLQEWERARKGRLGRGQALLLGLKLRLKLRTRLKKLRLDRLSRLGGQRGVRREIYGKASRRHGAGQARVCAGQQTSREGQRTAEGEGMGEGRTTERTTREPENQRKMTYPWQLCSTEENFLGGGRVSLSRGERRAAGLDRRKAACPVSTSQRTAG